MLVSPLTRMVNTRLLPISTCGTYPLLGTSKEFVNNDYEFIFIRYLLTSSSSCEWYMYNIICNKNGQNVEQESHNRAEAGSCRHHLPFLPSPRLWLGSLAGDRNDSKLGIPWTSTVTLRYDCLTALRVPSSRHMHACLTPCHA